MQIFRILDVRPNAPYLHYFLNFQAEDIRRFVPTFQYAASQDDKTRIAHADLIPPTLSLNWHFNPDGIFRPYIGAGVNYTVFSGEETSGALDGQSLKLDDSFGAAVQVGVDIGKENWFVNLNVRYIDMTSDGTELNGVEVGELELDPWMYGLHVGYRFGSGQPSESPRDGAGHRDGRSCRGSACCRRMGASTDQGGAG